MNLKSIMNLVVTFTFLQVIPPSYAMNEDDIPKTGWTCKSITDLGKGNSENCQNQGCNKKIRYVHTMEHENYNDELDVGSTCAVNMDVNGKAREENYKLRQKIGWDTPMSHDPYYKTLKKGNALLIAWRQKDGPHIGQFSYNVNGPSNRWFHTMKEAQEAAMDEKWPLFLTN